MPIAKESAGHGAGATRRQQQQTWNPTPIGFPNHNWDRSWVVFLPRKNVA